MVNLLTNYRKNQESINRLMNFDNLLLQFCISSLRELETNLRENAEVGITSVKCLPSITIKALEGIKSNKTFKSHYEDMYNQCLVLAVSYFTSTVKDIFLQSVNYSINYCHEILKKDNDNFAFTIKALKEMQFYIGDSLGELIVNKKEISFQDMQSTNRAFNDYFDLRLNFKDDKDQHNIVFGQAARHLIVHSIGKIDPKFLNQIDYAPKRIICHDLKEGEIIKITPAQIIIIQESMLNYITNISERFHEKVKNQ